MRPADCVRGDVRRRCGADRARRDEISGQGRLHRVLQHLDRGLPRCPRRCPRRRDHRRRGRRGGHVLGDAERRVPQPDGRHPAVRQDGSRTVHPGAAIPRGQMRLGEPHVRPDGSARAARGSSRRRRPPADQDRLRALRRGRPRARRAARAHALLVHVHWWNLRDCESASSRPPCRTRSSASCASSTGRELRAHGPCSSTSTSSSSSRTCSPPRR